MITEKFVFNYGGKKMKNKWLAEGVEYYPETDTILLIRCPKCGRENYALAVAKGICVWCGFNGRELLNEKKETE